jgi:hypothetical protein
MDVTYRIGQFPDIGDGLVQRDISHCESIIHVMLLILFTLFVFECEQGSPLYGKDLNSTVTDN